MGDHLTPVLRLVQGSAFEPNTTDMSGAPLVVKSGPNIGQPRKEWFMAGAISKLNQYGQPNAEWAILWDVLVREAAASFPALFPQGPMPQNGPDFRGAPGQPGVGGCLHPKFAFKVADGDGVDDNGKLNSTKPGMAGHWVVKFSSGFAPKVFQSNHYAPHEQIQDKEQLKRGYFMRVYMQPSGNGDAAKPGLYLNYNLVEISGWGEEIASGGPDAGQAFGGSPAPALPPGAFLTPQTPGYAAPPPAAPATPPATYAPPPPAAAAPPPPPPPPGRTMLPAAAGMTYESYIASGWTDALLVQHGYMAA